MESEESQERAREIRAQAVEQFQAALYESAPGRFERVLGWPTEERLPMALAWIEGAYDEMERWRSMGAAGERAAERLLRLCSGPGMARGLARAPAAASGAGWAEVFYEPQSALDKVGLEVAIPSLATARKAEAAENWVWFALGEPLAGEGLRAACCQGLIQARRGLAGELDALRRGVMERAGVALGDLAGSSQAQARAALECLGALASQDRTAWEKWREWGAPFTRDAALGAFMALSHANQGSPEGERASGALELRDYLKGAGVWEEGFAEAAGSDPRVGEVERAALESSILAEHVEPGAAGGPSRGALRV